jgi:hypothetical protein
MSADKAGRMSSLLRQALTRQREASELKVRLSYKRLSLIAARDMPRFYEPDLGSDPNNPFARDANNKLVRRGYWLDMNDRSLVLVMTQGIGAHLTNDEKRAHLADLKREHLIDQVCVQEILPPE